MTDTTGPEGALTRVGRNDSGPAPEVRTPNPSEGSPGQGRIRTTHEN